MIKYEFKFRGKRIPPDKEPRTLIIDDPEMKGNEMNIHRIACPECESINIKSIEHSFNNLSASETYECNNCNTKWENLYCSGECSIIESKQLTNKKD